MKYQERKSYRQVDYIIIQRRKEEAEHELMVKQNNYYKMMDKKADFERATVDANMRYNLYKNYTQLKNIQKEQFEQRQQRYYIRLTKKKKEKRKRKNCYFLQYILQTLVIILAINIS